MTIYFYYSQIETLVQRLEAADPALLLPVVPGEVGGHIGEPDLKSGIPDEHGAPVPAPPEHPCWKKLAIVFEALIIILRDRI